MCVTCGCEPENDNTNAEGEQKLSHPHQHHEHSHDDHHHSHVHQEHDPHDHFHQEHAYQEQTHHHDVHHHYYGPVYIYYGSEAEAPAYPGLSPDHTDVPHTVETGQTRHIRMEQDILAKNNQIAAKNRGWLQERNIKTLNLISSPGSGKTTLLEETLKLLEPQLCSVIEGDQQTSNDADRIEATGVKVIQINTGKGCHLDAEMVSKAIAQLQPEKESMLFIENVGNLICPSAFDLGEEHKVVILSVTEGEDKPLKYPDIFARADLLLINKTDLLPHLDFDIHTCIDNAKRINPNIITIPVSAITGEGLQNWLNWLRDA